MRLSVHLIASVPPGGGAAQDLAELARAADGWGFDRVTTGDVQGNHLECVTALAVMAGATRECEVAAEVLQPTTRHPGVVAASLASLHELAPGRVVAIIGRGDGAARNAGLRPATVAETRDHLLAVRELLTRGVTRYRGSEVRLPWPHREAAAVPLLLAAEGPRMLELAGEVADGALVGAGLEPLVVEWSLERLAAGARRAGRDADDLDVWFGARCGIARSSAEALARAREGLSSIANHALRGDYEAKLVPSRVRSALAAYHRSYRYEDKHRPGGGSPNADRLDALGLTDYAIERFGIVGTPDDAVARIRGLSRHGVTALALTAGDAAELTLLGREVVTRARESGGLAAGPNG